MAEKNICPYCGAFLEKNATHCEYCRHEIESVAKQHHEAVIKELRNDRRTMKKTLPKKIVAFFSHKIAIVVGILIVLVLAAVLFAFVSARLNNAAEDSIEEKWLKQLEEYYTNEQYKELAEFVNDNYIYGYKFDKYTQVAEAYYYYIRIVEEWDYYNEMKSKVNAELRVSNIYWVLYYGIQGMRAAQSGYTDKGILGNESLLKEIYADIEQVMLDKIGVTKEEISGMLALESLEETDMYPYSEAVVTRLGDR